MHRIAAAQSTTGAYKAHHEHCNLLYQPSAYLRSLEIAKAISLCTLVSSIPSDNEQHIHEVCTFQYSNHFEMNPDLSPARLLRPKILPAKGLTRTIYRVLPTPTKAMPDRTMHLVQQAPKLHFRLPSRLDSDPLQNCLCCHVLNIPIPIQLSLHRPKPLPNGLQPHLTLHQPNSRSLEIQSRACQAENHQRLISLTLRIGMVHQVYQAPEDYKLVHSECPVFSGSML